MKTAELIAANDFCVYHNVEYTFITSLHEAGLVEVTVINEIVFIPQTELQKLEKLVSLYELDINVAGIEAISHLLDRVEKLQEDVRYLKNRLSLYE
ncbi:chaperone modulator CbpM [Mucilaginibacter gossypii]|uniref:chaperone modulator CbpM n=1 Tax=Mucilaginibacter gossypii TaxID=551996 RepID=UPI000DCC33DB|nr:MULTISPECIES: chaperone modulator CbpM [Mucilaginibacter]QTE38394.1 chaperone modulator CbpM [Mucilaginibacter gossypii]RAV52134.1 MerR family transcriptional regulator [Mucilaginibacter rubeus]